jgi:hypothetical protein
VINTTSRNVTIFGARKPISKMIFFKKKLSSKSQYGTRVTDMTVYDIHNNDFGMGNVTGSSLTRMDVDRIGLVMQRIQNSDFGHLKN